MSSSQAEPKIRSLYGYVPSEGAAIAYIVLFSITAIIHAGQAAKYRTWWMYPTLALCALTEVIGWSGRLWSSFSPADLNPFLMQICTTILAPSFMTAASFTILGKLINRLGPQYSWLSPRNYLIIFLTADLASLIVQAIGGGQASVAVKAGRDATPGSRIMVAGILVQMAAITVFVLCAMEFLTRFHFDRPVRTVTDPEKAQPRGVLDKRMKLMILGLIISTVFIYIRSIYRTIELLDGWTGPIIRNEMLFNTLDAFPIISACVTFNIFHPGYLLPDQQTPPPSGSKPEVFDGSDSA